MNTKNKIPRLTWVAMVLAIALILITGVPAHAQTTVEVPVTVEGWEIAPTTVFVASQGLNVRQGPGTGYAVTRVAKCGEPLVVDFRATSGWLRVQNEGWISGRYTSTDPGVQCGGSVSPAAAPAAPASTDCAAQRVVFPSTVWRNNNPEHDARYNVVWDACQGGSSDHPPYGWYYQPGPLSKPVEPSETAIVMRTGRYRAICPEGELFHNWDGGHPFDQGRLIFHKLNGEFVVEQTAGAPDGEAYVFFRQFGGWAGLCGFERLDPPNW